MNSVSEIVGVYFKELMQFDSQIEWAVYIRMCSTNNIQLEKINGEKT